MKKKKAVATGVRVGGTTAPTDLLVCFPARMPKPICSPSRTPIMDKAVAARRRRRHLQLLPAPGGGGGGGKRGSPMFRGSRSTVVEEEDEPQSPKVTCAGQIKVVRPKTAEKDGERGGGTWSTVAEEIERRRKKKVSWLESVGIRRDALPFLGGALRLKVRCFGSLHATADSSTDGDDTGELAAAAGGSTVFSKWLMVMEGSEEPPEEDGRAKREAVDGFSTAAAPPANALLLMRCRSAPGKAVAARRGGGEEPPVGEDRDAVVFMSTAPDYLKLSIDIAEETWVVGGVDHHLARSRSWKR